MTWGVRQLLGFGVSYAHCFFIVLFFLGGLEVHVGYLVLVSWIIAQDYEPPLDAPSFHVHVDSIR